MDHIRVVGFSGKMGSGKSTAALLAKQHLERITGETWHVVAFADALKSIVAEMCGVPVSFCYTGAGKALAPRKPPGGLSPSMFGPDAGMPSLDVHTIDRANETIARHLEETTTIGELLQIVGQAVRLLEPDFWIDALEGTMVTGANYIVEDVRHPNELEWIREDMQGAVGRIANSGYNASASIGRDPSHPSETSLDSFSAWDFEIDNSPPHSSGKLMHQLAEKLGALVK